MPKPKSQFPKLRTHVRGHAFVWIDGRQIWLGRRDDPLTQEKYDRLLGLWLANGRKLPPPQAAEPASATVTMVVNEYRKHLQMTHKAGHVDAVLLGILPCHRMFGSTQAGEFSPSRLEAVRAIWIERRLTRSTISRYVNFIRRMFRWAASRDLIPVEVWHRLQTVEGIRRGVTNARESRRIRPVDDALVDPIQPFVSRQVWALIELQRLTGARGGELFGLTARDIDMSLEKSRGVWLYRPQRHKTEDHGVDRVLVFNNAAMKVLTPFLTPDRGLDAPLFSPREANREMAARDAHCHRRPRQKPNPTTGSVRWKNKHGSGEYSATRRIGDTYDANSYRRAIQRACEKAFPILKELQPAKGDSSKKRTQKRDARTQWKKDHDWHPHQLRHAWATKMRRLTDLETAQIGLGHTKPDTTLIYAERDLNKLIDAMSKVG